MGISWDIDGNLASCNFLQFHFANWKPPGSFLSLLMGHLGRRNLPGIVSKWLINPVGPHLWCLYVLIPFYKWVITCYHYSYIYLLSTVGSYNPLDDPPGGPCGRPPFRCQATLWPPSSHTSSKVADRPDSYDFFKALRDSRNLNELRTGSSDHLKKSGLGHLVPRKGISEETVSPIPWSGPLWNFDPLFYSEAAFVEFHHDPMPLCQISHTRSFFPNKWLLGGSSHES